MNTAVASKTVWTVNPYRTQISFSVKHMVSFSVVGCFEQFDGTYETGDDGDDAVVRLRLRVDSLDTRNASRDAHLKSDSFLNAAKYPFITFESVSVERAEGGLRRLHGNMTIRNVTRPVTFEAVHTGTFTDAQGGTRAEYEVNGVINRKDFGLVWDALTELGGTVVSKEIRLNARVELLKRD